MLQASVDGFGGAVGGAGVVEVGQDVLAAAGQGPGQCLDLLKPVWDGLNRPGFDGGSDDTEGSLSWDLRKYPDELRERATRTGVGRVG